MIYPYIMYGTWIIDMSLTLYLSILAEQKDSEYDFIELNPSLNFIFKKLGMKKGGILGIFIAFICLTFIILFSTYMGVIYELFLMWVGMYTMVFIAHIHSIIAFKNQHQ